MLNYRESICRNLEGYLTKAFDAVNSVPEPTEIEAIAKLSSFIVEEESKVNV